MASVKEAKQKFKNLLNELVSGHKIGCKRAAFLYNELQ